MTVTVRDDHLMDHAIAYAEKIAADRHRRPAWRSGRSTRECDPRTHPDLLSSHTAILATTEESRETVQALNERRHADLSGC